MHVLCRGEWAQLRWWTRWELRESRGIVLPRVTGLVGWATVWLKWCCLSLRCVRALADPSLTIAVNKHSKRVLKFPPASCCFFISLLADLISLGFSSQESSPGFLVPLWFRFRALQSSVTAFSVSILFMCFSPENAIITACSCLKPENLLPLSHFLPCKKMSCRNVWFL